MSVNNLFFDTEFWSKATVASIEKAIRANADNDLYGLEERTVIRHNDSNRHTLFYDTTWHEDHNKGYTVLHYATRYALADKTQGKDTYNYESANIVNYLLDKGIDPNHASENGRTPFDLYLLKHRLTNKNIEVFRSLVKVTKCALHKIIKTSNDVALLSEAIKIKSNLDEFDSAGNAPLHIAILAGKYDFISALVESGADVNMKHGSSGYTPLDFVSILNDRAMDSSSSQLSLERVREAKALLLLHGAKLGRDL